MKWQQLIIATLISAGLALSGTYFWIQQQTNLITQHIAESNEILQNHLFTLPIGAVISYTGTVENSIRQQLHQQRWLICDGNEYLIKDYPALYQVIHTLYGGDGKISFKVPDFRGVFLRGLDLGIDYDPERTLGSLQMDSNKKHVHDGQIALSGIHEHQGTTELEGEHRHRLEAEGFWFTSKQQNERPAITNVVDDDQRYWTTLEGQHTHPFHIESSGEHTHLLTLTAEGEQEARPKNYPVIYLIRF